MPTSEDSLPLSLMVNFFLLYFGDEVSLNCPVWFETHCTPVWLSTCLSRLSCWVADCVIKLDSNLSPVN